MITYYNIIKRIFQSYGFKIESKSGYSKYILAVKDNINLSIGYSDPDEEISTKCDLCLDTPHWSKKGGPDGHQACVDICPVKALKLVSEPPSQTDVAGYDVHLAPPPPKITRPAFLEAITPSEED